MYKSMTCVFLSGVDGLQERFNALRGSMQDLAIHDTEALASWLKNRHRRARPGRLLGATAMRKGVETFRCVAYKAASPPTDARYHREN